MRKSTLLWLFLAVVSGTILFHTSQRVTDGHVRLEALAQNLREEEETIRVLKAEWSYLNQPARLEKLSRQFLALQPLTGQQIIKPADLPLRPLSVSVPPPHVVATATATAAAQSGTGAMRPEKEKTPIVATRSKPRPSPSAAKKTRLSERRFDDRNFGDVMKSLTALHQERH